MSGTGGGSHAEEQIRSTVRLLQSCSQRWVGVELRVFPLVYPSFSDKIAERRNIMDDKKIITFQCTDQQANALEALAVFRNQSVSQLIRDILGTHIPQFAPLPPLPSTELPTPE